MNYSNLVNLIKSVAREKLEEATNNRHHSMRYARPMSQSGRYKPDKTPQLAQEEDDENEKKENIKAGRTATGQVANKINLEPEYNSPMSLNRGMPKPQIDTK